MGKATPTVKVHLDRERHLRFDFNAMAVFEEKKGVSLLNGIDLQKMTVTQLRTLFWACLIHEDPELTEEQVGAMLHIGNLTVVASAVAEVVQQSMPKGGKNRPLAGNRSNG